MSAEVEPNKEDEPKEQLKKSLKHKALENWQTGVKIIELLICAASVVAIFEPAQRTGIGKTHLHHLGITYTANTGHMIINVIFLITRAIRDKVSYKTYTLFSIVGSGVFLLTGVLLIFSKYDLEPNNFFHPETYLLTMLITAISLAFVNSLIFAIEAMLTYKKKLDY